MRKSGIGRRLEPQLPDIVKFLMRSAAVAAVDEHAVRPCIVDGLMVDPRRGPGLVRCDLAPDISGEIEYPGVLQIPQVAALAAKHDVLISVRVVHGHAVSPRRPGRRGRIPLRPAAFSAPSAGA